MPRGGNPVLITGCSSGIGRAAAERLIDNGFTVYATARRLDSIADLGERGAKLLELDVTDDASARAAVQAIEDAEGSVGALVNNAGYAQSGAIEAVPLDAVRAQFETNLFGYVRMAQLVLPAMRKAGSGRIINISSLAGRVTMPGAGYYSASKFAIEAISDALRFEASGFGVHVSVIEPGPIKSDFTGTANEAMASEAGETGPYDAFHQAVAEGDAETDDSFIAGKPEDVAKTIEKALSARRPRPRYRVTAVARALPKVRAVLPDRGWDAFLRTQVKPPQAP
jgi:NAD(P)-dependent dehydrogenase (short-subunit alcohol dehydrogenase family)